MTAQGKLIAVVGASGVGKDSVMRALVEASPRRFVLAKRTIDRPADAGGEDHAPATPAEFAELAAAGRFALWWTAHGQSYGIRREVHDDLVAGFDVLANVSRAKLLEAASVFPGLVVLHLTATPDTLRDRLTARGRENASQIAGRLARPAPALPASLPIVEISNDGPLAKTCAAALARLGRDDTCTLSPATEERR